LGHCYRKIFTIFAADKSIEKHPLIRNSVFAADKFYGVLSTGGSYSLQNGKGTSRSQTPDQFCDGITHHFLRTHYFGNKSIEFTFLELSMSGVSLVFALESAVIIDQFQPAQLELVASITETISKKRVIKDLKMEGKNIRKMMLMGSKVNFLIYGYHWKLENARKNSPDALSTVFMSSEESISIHFKHKKRSG
jgi:hypothetical protein